MCYHYLSTFLFFLVSGIELLQRQIATKRRQPLNSVTNLEIEQGQRKFETGSLQRQAALGEVNEKDTGEY